MKRPNEAKNLISNVILVVLVAVSVFLAGALAARYLTSGTGSDTARVAKWQVSAMVTPPADAEKIVSPDGTSQTGNYTVVFTNNSEVSAKGTVEINGIPAGMTAYVRETESGTGTALGSWTGCDIAMNGGTKTVYIYFTAASTVASDKYDITITPVFTQID